MQRCNSFDPARPLARALNHVGLLALCLSLVTSLAALAGCTVSTGDGGFDGSLFDEEDASMQPEVDAATSADAATVEDGGTPDAAEVPEGVALWPEQLASAVCDALEDCLGPLLLRDALGGRDCAQFGGGRLENGALSQLADSVAAGRVLFFEDEVETCLADVRALGCEVESSRLPSSCELALIGAAELGDPCAIDEDCVGEAFCDDGSCPGTCAELLPAGMPCSDDDQCEDGLICFDDGSDERCAAPAGLLDSCGEGEAPCRRGLFCLSDGVSASCENIDSLYFKLLGEECDAVGELCTPSLVCESVDTSSVGVCAETVSASESCKRSQPGYQCPAGQYCDAETPGETGACVELPQAGEPCAARDPECAQGHICIESECLPLGDNGDDCVNDSQCYSQRCGTDSACEPPPQCQL